MNLASRARDRYTAPGLAPLSTTYAGHYRVCQGVAPMPIVLVSVNQPNRPPDGQSTFRIDYAQARRGDSLLQRHMKCCLRQHSTAAAAAVTRGISLFNCQARCLANVFLIEGPYISYIYSLSSLLVLTAQYKPKGAHLILVYSPFQLHQTSAHINNIFVAAYL